MMSTRHGDRATRLLLALVLAMMVSACGAEEPETQDAGPTSEPASDAAAEPADSAAEPSDSAAEDEAPAELGLDSLRSVVPASAGGGLDTNIRLVQPTLEEILGVSMVVENIEGGSGAVGSQAVLNDGDDCSTVMFNQVPAFNYITTVEGVDVEPTDFTPVAQLTSDFGILRVLNDAPWEDFQAFVDDALTRPGEISVSVSTINSNNYTAMLAVEEATGADFNIVPFDGGGPSRTALLGGQVDATHAGVYNSLGIAEDSRVLAVQADENRWPEVTDEAPTMSEVLGTEVPNTQSNYGLFVTNVCSENYPERVAALEAAIIEASEDEAYLGRLEELDSLGSLDVVVGEDYAAIVAEAQEVVDATVTEG